MNARLVVSILLPALTVGLLGGCGGGSSGDPVRAMTAVMTGGLSEMGKKKGKKSVRRETPPANPAAGLWTLSGMVQVVDAPSGASVCDRPRHWCVLDAEFHEDLTFELLSRGGPVDLSCAGRYSVAKHRERVELRVDPDSLGDLGAEIEDVRITRFRLRDRDSRPSRIKIRIRGRDLSDPATRFVLKFEGRIERVR